MTASRASSVSAAQHRNQPRSSYFSAVGARRMAHLKSCQPPAPARTPSQKNTSIAMVRGGGYTPDELARCLFGVSEKHDEQDSTTFCARVAAAFQWQPEASEGSRTAASLQSRWQTLQRQIQKLLRRRAALSVSACFR